MAGDWIKMRADLHTHPKVVRMASALKADRLRISCLQPPQQGKTHVCTVAKVPKTIQHVLLFTCKVITSLIVIHSIHIRFIG
ncbi:hypothetical protein EI057_02935 [Escherichia coli]|nr:hypothetical protein [Escherichia coli]MQK71588.1 hypothetical protein [Escherichia coli]